MKTMTFAVCFILLAAPLPSMAQLNPNSLNLDGIVRNPRGRVSLMNQQEAKEVCAKIGGRLPTIRELMLWATQYGEKISETPQEGFKRSQLKNASGNLDTFYYNSSDYKSPNQEFGQYLYWSSDKDPDDAQITDLFSGFFGYPVMGGNTVGVDVSAVICIKSH